MRTKKEIEHLSLSEIIEIYLGNSLFQGIEINIAKEIAYQEIQNRSGEYRRINKVSELVSKLNESLSKFPTIEEISSVTLINNGQEVYKILKQLSTYCLESFQSNLSDLVSNIDALNKKLDEIWEHDPEYLRHCSKFNDKRTLSQSQEYYLNNNFENVLFTNSKIWKFQISSILGFDYMKFIIEQSNNSKITFLPIFIRYWNHDRKLVFNFIASFFSMASINNYLWILFLPENQSQNRIDEVKEDIRLFLTRLQKWPFSLFSVLPNKKINQIENGDIDFGVFVYDLEGFAPPAFVSSRIQMNFPVNSY